MATALVVSRGPRKTRYGRFEMTPLEQAESALETYKRSMYEGHPWVPGALFTSNPGLDLYILAAFQGWVEASREPHKRVSLSDDPNWRPSSVAPERLLRRRPLSRKEAVRIIDEWHGVPSGPNDDQGQTRSRRASLLSKLPNWLRSSYWRRSP